MPANATLSLPDVTLCCIDTRTPELAMFAMHQSMEKVCFGRHLLLSTSAASSLPLNGIELVEIPALTSIDHYSHFVIKDLAAYITTPFVLLIQWDGFVVNPAAWSPTFLEFDYIGAPWRDEKLGTTVGNGGFSLRSRRLLQALTGEQFEAANPEDMCICVTHRDALERHHGIRFADTQTAEQFACERGMWRKAFGFHGLFNFPHVFKALPLQAIIEKLPGQLTLSADAHQLTRNLIKFRLYDHAITLLNKQIAAGGLTFKRQRQKVQIMLGRLFSLSTLR